MIFLRLTFYPNFFFCKLKITALLFTSISLLSQAQDDNLKNIFDNDVADKSGIKLLKTETWLLKNGDNKEWAQKEYNDNQWQEIQNTFPNILNAASQKWEKKLWFRLHFEVDSSLCNQYISFNLRMRGAMQIFLNGKEVHSIGVIPDANHKEKAKYTEIHPVLLPLTDSKKYVLAIRYSNCTDESLLRAFSWTWAGFYKGFELEYLGKGSSDIEKYRQAIINLVSVHYIIASLIFTIGLFHFFTFIFIKSEKTHLWFSMYVVSIALSSSLSIFIDVGLAHSPPPFSAMLLIESINLPLSYLIDLATIRCLYLFFYNKTPKIWYYFLVLAFVSWFYILLFSNLSTASFIRTLFHICSLIEGVRMIIYALLKGKENPYIEKNIYIIIIGSLLAVSFETTGVILNVVYGLSVFSSGWLFFIANMTIICIVISLQTFIIRVDLQREKNIKLELEQARKIEEELALKEVEKELKIKFEKERIARDLHDNIGSQLTFLLKKIESIDYSNYEQDNEKIEELTRITIQELQNTVWVMKQEEITLEEFQNKMYDFIWKLGDLPDVKINTNFETKNANQIVFNSEQAINSFRIIQEALQNALKYSRATEISIKIVAKTSKTIFFSVSDNGVGFDKNKVEEKKQHNGLLNMQARSEILGNELLINSKPNHGTHIEFNFNIKQKTNTS